MFYIRSQIQNPTMPFHPETTCSPSGLTNPLDAYELAIFSKKNHGAPTAVDDSYALPPTRGERLNLMPLQPTLTRCPVALFYDSCKLVKFDDNDIHHNYVFCWRNSRFDSDSDKTGTYNNI
jgi:hypothetical protein